MDIQAGLITDIQQRYITLKYAYFYLGMNKNFFNNEVRPYLKEYKFGRAVRFDYLDLLLWINQNIQRYECPGKFSGENLWDKKHPGSSKEVKFGILTKPSTESEFNAALEQVALKKPKRS